MSIVNMGANGTYTCEHEECGHQVCADVHAYAWHKARTHNERNLHNALRSNR